MNESVGVKEVAINNIVMDIECYENNIKQLLNQIASTYEIMAKCTNYNGSQTYLSKSKIVKGNINTIVNNLENYKYDLVSVKKKYRNASITFAEDLMSKANRINVGSQYVRKK